MDGPPLEHWLYGSMAPRPGCVLFCEHSQSRGGDVELTFSLLASAFPPLVRPSSVDPLAHYGPSFTKWGPTFKERGLVGIPHAVTIDPRAANQSVPISSRRGGRPEEGQARPAPRRRETDPSSLPFARPRSIFAKSDIYLKPEFTNWILGMVTGNSGLLVVEGESRSGHLLPIWARSLTSSPASDPSSPRRAAQAHRE